MQINQNDDETRLQYLMRVLRHYMLAHGHATIEYDGANCDGICLAQDIENELDEPTREVESLVWYVHGREAYRANFSFGYYEIKEITNGDYSVWVNHIIYVGTECTLADAKEAARQDYAKRVRSGLKYGGGK